MAKTGKAYTHAILMGDLILSTKAPSIQALHRAFNDAVSEANRRHRTKLDSPLTITLGDEFQGLAASLSDGLTIIRELRRKLLADRVGCRFVLGFVRIETPVNRSKAWNMMGPGLADAREILLEKKRRLTRFSAYRFSLPEDPIAENLLDAVGWAISRVEDNWTPRQLEVMNVIDAGLDLPDTTLAKRLKVTPRVFYRLKQRADREFYDNMWQAVEGALKDLDKKIERA